MSLPRVAIAALLVTSLFALAGCSPVSSPPAEGTDQGASSEPGSGQEETDDFLASIDDVAGTEWTGLDDNFNDRITFIFAVDGSVSYRNTNGTFTDPADTWSVTNGVLAFQTTYGGPFGVGTHTGTYDAATGVLTVEYTTTTNRASSYTLSQVD